MIKLRRIREWSGWHIWISSGGDTLRKETTWKRNRRLEDNIEMDFIEIGWECVDISGSAYEG